MSAREIMSRLAELKRGRDYRAAYALVQEALAAQPEDPSLLVDEVYLLQRLGRTGEARRKAEERFEILKDSQFFLKTYLSILERQGARGDIEAFFEKHLLSRRAGGEDLYLFAARLAQRVFGGERGAGVAARALVLVPGSKALEGFASGGGGGGGAAAGGGGSGYRRYSEKFRGRSVDEAIEEIEAVRVLPEFAADHGLLLVLAELYKRKGRHDRAIEVYREILAFRDDDFTRKMLGYACYRQEDYDGALRCLGDCLVRDPGDRILKTTVFAIFKRRNDYQGLEKLVKEVLGANPEAKHVLGLLARAKKWV